MEADFQRNHFKLMTFVLLFSSLLRFLSLHLKMSTTRSFYRPKTRVFFSRKYKDIHI